MLRLRHAGLPGVLPRLRVVQPPPGGDRRRTGPGGRRPGRPVGASRGRDLRHRGSVLMRALSVQPPWSWAITWAGKTVENRTWLTTYRGEVAVHASKKLDSDALEDWRIVEAITRPGAPRLRYDFGCIVAVAEIRTCHWPADCRTCSPWAVEGQYHFVLGGVRPLAEPVPARGMLGLWPVPEDIESAVRAQLGEADRA